ncbi:MAG: N-acetyl-gamma-glutamyl-phosphate reductase, partial [Oscillospiraceae bacterium]|nr:N-acetyl-gamma-glutamyl-phosphate reductase [Oscillospiraceae bacterium]
MIVTVPLRLPAMPLWEVLSGHYAGQEHVTVAPFGGEEFLSGGFLDMAAPDPDVMELFVFGHDEQAVLAARLDNLGKGASGAAVQCMKLRFSI